MDLKFLGQTGQQIPEIGFGTGPYVGGLLPIRAAIDHGACLIDTAESYGTEEVVGEAICGRRADVFLATKVLPHHFRRRELIAAAENSLRRLQTDYIDLYQLHWPNYTVPIEEPMGAMEELVQAGKVRFIGVSNFSVGELKKAQSVLSKNRIVSNQVRYSLMNRTIETDVLDFCLQEGVTIIAHSPLGGRFADLLAHDPQETLAQIAGATAKTQAQIALNWVLAPEHVVAIPKASSVTHAVENCGASGWRLSQADYDLLSAQIRYKRQGKMTSAVKRYRQRVLQWFGKL